MKCEIIGCESSSYGLKKWRQVFCIRHKCQRIFVVAFLNSYVFICYFLYLYLFSTIYWWNLFSAVNIYFCNLVNLTRVYKT